MFALVRPFLQICIFQIGPQRLPESLLLLGMVLTAHSITNGLALALIRPDGPAVLAGLTATLLLAALTSTALVLQRRQARLVQTLSALAGSFVVIDLAILPMMSWKLSLHAAGTESALPDLIALSLTGWSLCVQGHIMRHALSIPFFLGLLLSLFFFWISINVMYSLFLPELGG